MVLLSGEYVRLILIANVIALPFAWILINRWLDGYAYRVDFSWWLLLLPFSRHSFAGLYFNKPSGFQGIANKSGTCVEVRVSLWVNLLGARSWELIWQPKASFVVRALDARRYPVLFFHR
jgi:hypothetical protein